jgi:hypothetical protein
MASTKEVPINRALIKLGSKTITSMTGTETNAETMNGLYWDSLGEIMAETNWLFATKTINLVKVSGESINIADAESHSETSGYDFGDVVSLPGGVFYCIDDFPDWEVRSFYDINDYVYISDTIYVCILRHESTALLAPGATPLIWVEYAAASDLNPVVGSKKDLFWHQLTEDPDNADEYPLDYFEPEWTTYNLDFVYRVPKDYVRLLGWSSPSVSVRQEGLYFLSDWKGLGMKYIYFNIDVREYPTYFIGSFADKLAADACFTITNSVTKTEKYNIFYEDVSIKKAIAKNGQGQSSQTPKTDDWLLSKYGGEITQTQRRIIY